MDKYLNKITNIDCLKGLKEIPENSIDLVVTSPPYNLSIEYDVYRDDKPIDEYTSFLMAIAEELFRVIKPNGRVCLNIPCDGSMKENLNEKSKCDISYIIKDIFYKVGFKYRDKIFWDKQNITSRMAMGSFESASSPNILLPFEEIVVLYKESPKKSKKNGNVNEIVDREFINYTNGHWIIKGQSKPKDKSKCPVPFPQEIPHRLIKLFSYRDDIVLDPFSGSGTTCIVAKKLGRNFIGFELSEEYWKQSIKRINKL